MIDLHSHIIFDVDDGPEDLQEAYDLVVESYKQGVRQLVATSHRRRGMFETPEDKNWENYQILKAVVERDYPNMQLYYGAEIYYTADVLEKLAKETIPTINDSRLALIEFSKNTSWKSIKEGLKKVLMLGIVPLVAHIERYDALAFDGERVQELIDMGCYTQVNSSHVLKVKMFDKDKEFKRRVAYFLDYDLVHVVSSDMHNLDQRPPFMKEARRFVRENYGLERADLLFNDHAESLLTKNYI